MEKILALDVGDRRIGLAVSDELGWFAHGLTTLERTNLKRDISIIAELIEEHEIGKIVVGLPLNMDGSKGSQAEKTLEFIESMKESISLPIITWDERLTSQEAARPLEEAGLNWRKKKKVIDQVAAVLILQSFLDFEKLKAKRLDTE